MRPLLLVILCTASAARADDSRLREALRSAKSEVQALEDEKAAWQAKDAESKKELAALREQLASAEKAAAKKGSDPGAKQKIAQLSRDNAQLADSLAQCRKSEAGAGEAAHKSEEERAQLTAKADGLASRAAEAQARNVRLFKLGNEILDRLSKAGGVCEPFLGLRRVQFENLVQDYQDKLLELQGGAQ